MNKLLCLFSLIFVLVVQSAWAQDTIKIQGVAIDSRGIPLAEGEKDITFNVYDSGDSETSLWRLV